MHKFGKEFVYSGL